VAWLVDPDVRTVDALARLRLAAGRAGRGFVLRGASDELADLVELMGLGEVLRVEPGGKPEEGEQVLGVEEERDPGEPVA
jgi:anti-anti-sigma regulatory factor